MFRIKICGITTPDDARLAQEAGADAIGLNFYEKSRRYVDPQVAKAIVSELSQGTTSVGLFVNCSAEVIREVNEIVPLDVIQLHGDEPPQLLRELAGLTILRAFRFGPEGMKPIAEYLDACNTLACMPQGVLIDAYAQGAYGGTGKQADWQRLSAERSELPALPLILAGGLTAENVADAIQVVRPAGVDVSSGVEMPTESVKRTAKDATLVTRFVAEASQTFLTVRSKLYDE